MSRRRWKVLPGVSSACGLHPGSKSWLPCPHCERARVANEAALANVVPSHRAADTRLTDEDVASIQKAREAGESVQDIATRYNKGLTTIKSVIAGQYVTITIARKRHGERALPVPGQSARSMAIIPTQRART